MRETILEMAITRGWRREFHLRCSALLLLLCVATLDSAAIDSFGQTAKKDQLLANYKKNIGKLEQMSKNISGKGTYTQLNEKIKYENETLGSQRKEEKEQKREVFYSESDGKRKLRYLGVIGHGYDAYFDRIFVDAGRDDRFALQRSSASSPYMLIAHKSIGRPFAGALDEWSARFKSSFYIEEIGYITDLLDDSRFKIVNIEEFKNNESNIIKIYFEYKRDDLHQVSGWLGLDPKRNWAIVSQHHQSSASKIRVDTFDKEIDYLELDSGFPIPKKIVASRAMKFLNFQKDDEGNYTKDQTLTERKYEFEMTEASSQPTPAREYSLAFFDLGDVTRPPGRSPNYLPISAFMIGACSLLVAFIIKRYFRIR